MPAARTYPGVYIEEIPSGVRTIMGVGTLVTAFVGPAKRGKIAQAGEPVGMQHLLSAAQAGCAKLERPITEGDIAGWV